MASNKPSESPPSRTINLSLLAIVAEGFFSRLSFGIITFALPLYAYHLGFSVLEISLLVTLTEATALVCKPAIGWICDRYVFKLVYTTSIGLRSLVAFLLIILSSPWQLYTIKSVHGTAEMLKGIFPVLATQYAGLNEAQTGSIFIASTLAVLVSGPLFGWLSDRGNRKLVLLLRSLGNTISSIIYLVFPSFHGLATGKLVDDMGKAAFRPAWGSLMAHVSSFDRSRRAQTISWMLIGEDAGKILAPLVAGFLWTSFGLTAMLTVRILLSIITEVYATTIIDNPKIK
ncbi:MAG: MFS transporter [Xenococcaceae cyanobacterium MO_188.B19]|nr:MFS transporter [Xenococcaceae cyanobacterium MO_188.B19]